jgi:DNA-binding HxlR family transcriptional regulator
MLTERLQELEQQGIVERTVLPESPVRVEYSLTPKGHALAEAVDAISDWAHKMERSSGRKRPRAHEANNKARTQGLIADVKRSRYRQ